jgi:hypothetical protein
MLQRLFPRKFVPKISRQEILAAIPVRNSLVEWETNDEEEVVLKIPRREDRAGRIMQRVFVAPPFKQVVLDELGSDVWHLCTGENDVDTIVKSLARKYKLGRREVELSLANYLRTLAQRGYIGLAKPSAIGSQRSAREVRRRGPQSGGASSRATEADC